MAARRTLRDDLPVSTHCFFTNTDRQTGLLFLKDAKEGRKKTCLDPAICRDYQITRKTTFAFHGRLSRGESHRSLHRKHSIHKERLYIKLTRVEKTPLLSTLQEQQGRLRRMNSWLAGVARRAFSLEAVPLAGCVTQRCWPSNEDSPEWLVPDSGLGCSAVGSALVN